MISSEIVLICEGLISQQPPNKVAPSFNLLSTNFLNTFGLNIKYIMINKY